MVKDVYIRLSVEADHLRADRLGWARLLGNESLKFPMLEFLTLDFTDWTLGDNQGLIVSSALRLLRFCSMEVFNFLAGASID